MREGVDLTVLTVVMVTLAVAYAVLYVWTLARLARRAAHLPGR